MNPTLLCAIFSLRQSHRQTIVPLQIVDAIYVYDSYVARSMDHTGNIIRGSDFTGLTYRLGNIVGTILDVKAVTLNIDEVI